MSKYRKKPVVIEAERSGVLLTAEFISRQRSGLSAAEMICYAAMEK